MNIPRLLGAEGLDGVNGGGAARGEIAGQEGGEYEASGDGDVGDGVNRVDLEEQGRHEAHQDDGDDEATDDADAGQE